MRLSKVARSAALVRADVVSQGPDAKLVQFGADEKQAAAGVPLWEGVAAAALIFLPVYQLAISPVTHVLLAR